MIILRRRARVRKAEALESGPLYTGWNITSCPRFNRQYPPPVQRKADRDRKGCNQARIQKSKNDQVTAFVVFTAFYCTKNICLVKHRGTSEQFCTEYFEKIGFEKYLVKHRP